MKFFAFVGGKYQIVTAEITDKNQVNNMIHYYLIKAPESVKNKWPALTSMDLTLLPEEYQRVDQSIDINEICAICNKLPNQAERRS